MDDEDNVADRVPERRAVEHGPGREPLKVYCDRCGQDADTGDHAACVRARAMEPPRYCPRCRRRMVVQVTPTHWTARCVEHGELTASA